MKPEYRSSVFNYAVIRSIIFINYLAKSDKKSQ